jgi:DNA-binding FadR family transcriptional regulator
MTEPLRVVDVASPVRVPKTAELVASHLRRRIVLGELKEGDALPPESALMEQFGVSRPTLREAFRVLESEALISVRRGARGGARVHIPDGDVAARYAGLVLQFRGTTLADVYAARSAIELAALDAMRPRVTKAALKPLRENLELMDESIDDPERTILLQEEFHRLIVEIAGNQTLHIFEQMIHHIIELHGTAYVARWTGSPQQARWAIAGGRTHHKVVDLLQKGDFDAAIDLWRRHLDEASETVLHGVDAKTVLDLLN